ncbi:MULTISPECIES: XdhC family protein [Xanthomonas]|uniref:XdhC family protein n=1 Tax=Xanthomonas TaxID=338 RepID=UPI000CEE6B4F|nr:XdhC family protein [Xanthomonas arboricola]PPT86738.1 xanthine dehydrogenase [Xanthomonas arboricola]PPU10357.1 xanthine dehydrogenase [Xanthomonas arboricola]PPU47850.1 xanthine dehydrogenase [Xanthomonas arboricola]
MATSATPAPLGLEWPAWPHYALQEDLLPILREWHAIGRRVALATLIEVHGSSPRQLGSQMIVSDHGHVAGYVSGGCVEAAVAQEAIRALHDGSPRLLDYGHGSEVMDIQLSCGGRIGILVCPLNDLNVHLARWLDARQQRNLFYAALDRSTGGLRYPSSPSQLHTNEFLLTYRPPPRLILVGSDPAVLALVTLARQMEIELRVLRPHGPSEPPPGLPHSHYDRRALGEALVDLVLDANCALYSLTHDNELDLQVARHGLASVAACVGILGSRQKKETRLRALRELGHDEQSLARLRLPAGWRLGHSSPHSIAVGIIAETLEAIVGAAGHGCD